MVFGVGEKLVSKRVKVYQKMPEKYLSYLDMSGINPPFGTPIIVNAWSSFLVHLFIFVIIPIIYNLSHFYSFLGS